jgi:hypothetical protein
VERFVTMARLYRPYIPIDVKCRLALMALGEMFIEKRLAYHREHRRLGHFLAELLGELARLMCCEVSDLRLDHDPPLALREKRYVKGTIVYTPDANDLAHLFFRPHGAQFAGSHDIKTRVRGDHGQFSDLALIRREKNRRAKKLKKNPRFWRTPRSTRKWASRPFPRKGL